jgi:hypothetical protein
MNRIKFAAFAGLTILMAAAANAQTTEEPKACTNETLKGAYGVIITGTRPAPSVPVGQPGFVGQFEQVQGSIVQVFDGKGSFTQVESQKGTTSGTVLDRAGRGVYTVNADCSVTVTVSPAPGVQIVSKGVIVDGGKEYRSVTVIPETISVQASGRRVN